MGKTARLPRMTAVLAAAAAGVIAFSGVLPGTAAPPPSQAPVIPGAELAKAFAAAADQYDVPRDLLVALGYAESHLDGHNGKPSQAGGYGMMHLVSNPANRTLSEATKLTGLPTERVARESAANIAGAAAVLDSYADQAGLSEAQRDDVDNWYQVVAKYSHSADLATGRLYADEVFRLIGDGLKVKSGEGAGITVSPTKVAPERGKYAGSTMGAMAVDYPGAIWSAASTSNYQVANRPASHTIDRIVVHTTQGSYAGTISWFKNPSSQVSAHYVIRSSDGQITQMVREKDIGWHVRNANSRSIGIEHEGWVNDPSWYTDAMYRASAALTKNIAERRGIPKDRTHIVGHVEVPGNDHTDPGPHWNWTYYMSLVKGGGGDPEPEYNFTTYGSGVNVRSDAKVTASIVTTLPGPTRVFVVCQKEGDAVTAEGTTNKWWSKLRDQNGYMTNIYIDHPDAQLPGVPVCGVGQTINTTGTNVNVRSQPTTASTVLRVLPGPTTQVAVCQAAGQTVTINGVANSWWAKLQAGGYVSNHYVSGANPKVAGLADC